MSIRVGRRSVLGGIAAATVLPGRFSIAQGSTRGAISVAVQQLATSNTLEPLREQSIAGNRIFYSFLEPLVDRNYQGNLEQVPGLATAWRRIDARTVEFDLRKGVKFHNGDEMTAEDVAFTFGKEHMFGQGNEKTDISNAVTTAQATPTAGGPPPEVRAIALRVLPQFDRVEIVDRYTVRFVNKTPDVTLEGRLTVNGAEIISRRAFVEAGDWLKWSRKPIGTGPYKIKEFQADQHLILEAHDEYWGGRPPVQEVRFLLVPEVASRINGLISGQYDFITDIPPDQISAVEKHSGSEVLGGLVPNHRMIVFDYHHPQLKDPLVRRAMTHAIDRQLIVDSLWSGRTRVPPGLQWEFYDKMFIADWKVPAYDPDLARSLVKQSGYKGDPIPFRVLNNYYTNQVATAQALTEMWHAVGVNAQIEMKENWQQIFATNVPRAVRDWSNSAGFNDPVSSLNAQHGPTGAQQQFGEWTNAEFNTLCNQIETNTDMQQRRTMFRRMLEIAEREDPAYTVLHQNCTFTGKRKSIGWKPSPSFVLDFRARNLKMPT